MTFLYMSNINLWQLNCRTLVSGRGFKHLKIIPQISCYMAMPSRRLPQKSMRVGGGALKHHRKQNREKLPKSTRNSPQKVTQNGTALSSVQVGVIRKLYNFCYPDKENALKEGTLISIFCVILTQKEQEFYIIINLY